MPARPFPQFVGYLVRRLRALCPSLGKLKIAQTLARAGLHLGTTSVGRMLKQESRPTPRHVEHQTAGQVVTAKYPNHLWHVDLTTVPIVSGFWTAWLPFALPQCWPFCWWVVVALDHFSRRVMGFAVYPAPPASQAVRAFLGRTMRSAKAKPKYIVCDQGPQFHSDGFDAWCRRRGIRPRFGAVGKHGSIAVIERFILTLKTRCTRWLGLVPLRRDACFGELALFTEWYNRCWPHTSLQGRTPDEAYYRLFPECRRPRYEPRPRWPRGAPCASPHTLVKGKPGARLEIDVQFHAGRRHLPIVNLRRA